MFTGIIEELGRISAIEPIAGGLRLFIEAKEVLKDLKTGDSLAVNGACLTIVGRRDAELAVEAVGETLEKTTIGSWKIGGQVNLERSLSAAGRFGGHFVQGHVNAAGRITQWYPRGENWFLEVEIPPHLMRYIIPEGSIAIEGISLTVASLNSNRVGINIIPHTAKATNLQFKQVGEAVNIEVDMIAKYLEKLMEVMRNS